MRVEKKMVGDTEINAVDARELHEFLEVKSDFQIGLKVRSKNIILNKVLISLL